MSTTRPYPAGDCGPEPEGAATAAAGAGSAGALGGVAGASAGPAGTAGGAEQPGAQGNSAPPVQPAPTAARQPGHSVQAEPGKGHPMRQVRRLRLVGVSGAVPRARDFVRQALQDWGWLPAATGDQRAAAEDVLLVVSELVTNACLHADGPEELRVGSGTEVLRLEIVDQGSGSPSPRTPHRAGRPGGHGMFIVQRLCLDWGVVRNPEGMGKTVWAELAAPG
ncbi:anti-sigma regulatory factor (Ser/Thr protein kinase) [Streptomyces sp. Amel2xB2]|uniref:ATP-binding protein n=1 Tax=Streptomyces sp. Amel2xB2 TaxID=1305829 RepID=UPI000DBA2355|nr:ATP-binding protein [Streptomyces sp. Amel2xB2]RAJ62577.1 anti-sigma regulatory factor (Ser/Thr protein kinase) [Streptomyces sp. Amel2xB2]